MPGDLDRDLLAGIRRGQPVGRRGRVFDGRAAALPLVGVADRPRRRRECRGCREQLPDNVRPGDGRRVQRECPAGDHGGRRARCGTGQEAGFAAGHLEGDGVAGIRIGELVRHPRCTGDQDVGAVPAVSDGGSARAPGHKRRGQRRADLRFAREVRKRCVQVRVRLQCHVGVVELRSVGLEIRVGRRQRVERATGRSGQPPPGRIDRCWLARWHHLDRVVTAVHEEAVVTVAVCRGRLGGGQIDRRQPHPRVQVYRNAGESGRSRQVARGHGSGENLAPLEVHVDVADDHTISDNQVGRANAGVLRQLSAEIVASIPGLDDRLVRARGEV